MANLSRQVEEIIGQVRKERIINCSNCVRAVAFQGIQDAGVARGRPGFLAPGNFLRRLKAAQNLLCVRRTGIAKRDNQCLCANFFHRVTGVDPAGLAVTASSTVNRASVPGCRRGLCSPEEALRITLVAATSRSPFGSRDRSPASRVPSVSSSLWQCAQQAGAGVRAFDLCRLAMWRAALVLAKPQLVVGRTEVYPYIDRLQTQQIITCPHR